MKRSRWVLAAGEFAGLLAVYLVVTPFVRDHMLQFTRTYRERSEGEALAICAGELQHVIAQFTRTYRERSEGEALAHSLVSTDSFLEYSATHPEQVAIACWELGDEHNGLSFNATRTQPAAQASALLVLAAFANGVDPEGASEAPVSLADWERFWLPGTDGGAHLAALLDARASGALQADAGNFAIAGSAPKALDQELRVRDLVRAMIRHADPAAMDVLLGHLGRARLSERVLGLGFPAEALPLPAAGVQLTLASGADVPELLARFRALPVGAYADAAWSSFLQLRDDDALRARSLERLEQHVTRFSLRETAQLNAALAPRGSAARYAHLMEQILTDRVRGASYMRAQLEQPPQAAGAHEQIERYGGFRASEPGMYASVSYGKVRGGNATRVLAVMLHKLPMAVWLQLSSGSLLRRFEGELLSDESFRSRAKVRLDPGAKEEEAEARWVR